MRQLKITKSKGVSNIIEYLKDDNFNLDEFIKEIAETDKFIRHEERSLLNELQQGPRPRCHVLLSELENLQDVSYEDMHANHYETCNETNELRWLNACRVVSAAREYENSGKPMNELLIAGMQGVKNAALAYKFRPNVSFGDFAEPVIRRHIEQYIQTGDLSFAGLCKEYEEILTKAQEAYDAYRNPKCPVAIYHTQHEKARAHLFANAKISRCRKEIRMAADYAEWRLVDIAVHLPDDYDERDKFIRTGAFTLHDALYCGECKDFVKPVGGEWCICAANGTRVPVNELTDRDSMRGALESLLQVLENIPWTRTLDFSEWRADTGI